MSPLILAALLIGPPFFFAVGWSLRTMTCRRYPDHE